MLARGAVPLLLVASFASADEADSTVPLRNVEIVDREGTTSRLAGLHRLSGEDRFQGFLGAGQIEVPYDRVREIRIPGPAHPGGRPRATLTQRSGHVVEATFDEREGEQLLSGYAPFGRVTVFFRDIRRIRFLGPTAREDLPVYGPPARGVDVRLRDREGVVTELVGFRRSLNEDAIPAVRGATSVAIPLRIVKRLEIHAEKEGAGPRTGRVTLRDGATVDFRLPSYVEEAQYRGEAEFGTFRIRLGKIRELEVHRVTPELRDLDPLEAAQGRDTTEDEPAR